MARGSGHCCGCQACHEVPNRPTTGAAYTLRTKFSTLIRDVATTGDSGSGVFDPNRKCLLGIISGKLTSHTTEGDKDIAKYFVPAAAIRDFMPDEFRP